MSDDDTVEIDTKNLDKFIKILKNKMKDIHVGILSSNNVRSGSSAGNAEIGSYHEFGTSKHPVRSFLRVPLIEQLPKKIESSGAFDQNVVKEVFAQGSTEPWLKKIAILAESVVLGAFSSRGYGKWPSWSKGYESKTGDMLVDSKQLRDSISSEIK